MITDIHYGRLSPIKNSAHYSRHGYPLMVDIRWWVSDDIPLYESLNTYLRFFIEGEEYRIYNPLRLQFNINYLISTIKMFFAKVDQFPEGFEVISK